MPKGVRGFQKGNNANPAGGPKIPEDLRAAHKLTKTMIMDILTMYLSMRVETLDLILKDNSKPVMHHIVARIAKLAIENGDHQRLNFFMDRLIGKVTDKVEHTMPKPVMVKYSDGSAVVLSAKKDEEE